MPKNMEIDFVRETLISTIQHEYIKHPLKYIGSENDISLVSYYQHLANGEAVNRFTDFVRNLTNQQNRTHIIANGVIVAPTNPTITNINQATIIPMEFSVAFRCTIDDIEKVKDTLEHMVSIVKGRKHDIAELDNGELFMVGTIGNNSIGQPEINNGDYIGSYSGEDLSGIPTRLNTLIASGFVHVPTFNEQDHCYFYFEDLDDNTLSVAYGTYDSTTQTWSFSKIVDDYESYPDIIFPSTHNSFTKWKVSISFESFRLSEPRQINKVDFVDLSFGGSATLVSEYVKLGNELTKVGIKRYKIVKSDNGDSDIIFDDIDFTWLEPLEMPSGNAPSTLANQLKSNNFLNNSHTNGLTITNQYTFILDESINFLKQLFLYARYGKQTYITPNIIYNVQEIWSSWGRVELIDFLAKINESIDIENSESDTLTINLPLQIQGENN